VTAAVACNEEESENHPKKNITNCRLKVDQEVLPGQIAFT